MFKKEVDLDQLINVKDKQNVPLAVKLLKLIYEKTTMKADDLISNNQCEKDVYNEYQLLGEITNLFLSIFTNTQII